MTLDLDKLAVEIGGFAKTRFRVFRDPEWDMPDMIQSNGIDDHEDDWSDFAEVQAVAIGTAMWLLLVLIFRGEG